MQVYDHAADIDAIALDQRLRFAATFLIEGSPLADKVTVMERDSMFGSGKVTTLVPYQAIPISSWSDGEKVLWRFLASLAGGHEIDLSQIAGYFRGSPEAPRIIAAFVALVGDD